MNLALGTYTIGYGDAGIDQTVRAMLALIAEGAKHPAVQACATAIADNAPLGDTPLADGYQLIAEVRGWVADRWEFVLDHDLPATDYGQPDADVTELLHSPEAQLNIIAARGVMRGDCDDAAILTAALVAALGLEYRIVCAGFGLDKNDTTAQYAHVWTEARPSGGAEFLELDVTRQSQAIPDGAISRAATWSPS